MKTLNLYKNRKSTAIKVGKDTYLIPNEYTVEEVERMLELRVKREEMNKAEAIVGLEQAQYREYLNVVFDQLSILFQHFQPEVTSEELKKRITEKEALEIVDFYNEHRQSKLSDRKTEAKKKDKKALVELKEIRRMVTFMVVSGFSLLEVRKLYLDEFHQYYQELYYNLEALGKIKEGNYEKMMRSNPEATAEDTVAKLRKQMFSTINKMQK